MRIIGLHGPAGSGKSTALRVVQEAGDAVLYFYPAPEGDDALWGMDANSKRVAPMRTLIHEYSALLTRNAIIFIDGVDTVDEAKLVRRYPEGLVIALRQRDQPASSSDLPLGCVDAIVHNCGDEEELGVRLWEAVHTFS